MNTSTFAPKLSRPHPARMGGTQDVYQFANGFGASVVQFPGSYGYDAGLWELAVVKFDGDDYSICYDTPITDDVLGHLSDAEVQQTLARINALAAA